MDDNQDEYIDLKEFVYVLFKIYYSKFEEQVKLVFDIYDFDRDGYITKEDVRIILSYIPALRDDTDDNEEVKEGTFSQGGGGYDEFSTRVKIQEEISELLEMVFKDKEKIDLDQFQEINETISSDMLVTLLSLLRDKLPCSEKFYRIQQKYIDENEKATGASKLNLKDLKINTKQKSIPSPNILKSLSPLAKQKSLDCNSASHLARLAKQDSFKGSSKGINEEEIDIDKFKKNKKRGDGEAEVANIEDADSPTVKDGMVRLANTKTETKSILSRSSKNIFASPTAFLAGSGTTKEDQDFTSSSKETVEFEGDMMRKAKEDKFKKYHYKLYDKELYVYKSNKEKDHKTMVNLVGVFLRTEPPEPLDKKNTLYPFTLMLPNKERTFYLLSEEDRETWISKIKKAIGYANLYDYYDVKEAVGKGKFGTIKLGIHKKTGKKVAVKIMKKKQMTLQDIVLQKREIEILKI